MYCRKCGYDIPEGGVFCPNCGTHVDPGMEDLPKNNKYASESEKTYNNVRTDKRKQTAKNQQAAVDSTQLPMKWYKFIIYVQLFLFALLNVGNGVQYLQGLQYGADAARVYSYYGSGLKNADMAEGIACIVLAAAAIVVRQQLKKFKKGAATNYILLNVAQIVVMIIYAAVFTSVTGINAFEDSSVSASCMSSVVMILANVKYFKNRKHLFVN